MAPDVPESRNRARKEHDPKNLTPLNPRRQKRIDDADVRFGRFGRAILEQSHALARLKRYSCYDRSNRNVNCIAPCPVSAQLPEVGRVLFGH